LGQATESFIDLESGSELSVQKSSPVALTEELWLNSFNPLLSFSAKNNQERLEHKTFTKNPDFSHSVRK